MVNWLHKRRSRHKVHQHLLAHCNTTSAIHVNLWIVIEFSGHVIVIYIADVVVIVICVITFTYLITDNGWIKFTDFQPITWQCPRMRRFGEIDQTFVFVRNTNTWMFVDRFFVCIRISVAMWKMTATWTCQAIWLWWWWCCRSTCFYRWYRCDGIFESYSTNQMQRINYKLLFKSMLLHCLPSSSMTNTSSSLSMLFWLVKWLPSCEPAITFKPIPLSTNGEVEFNWCDGGIDEFGVGNDDPVIDAFDDECIKTESAASTYDRNSELPKYSSRTNLATWKYDYSITIRVRRR